MTEHEWSPSEMALHQIESNGFEHIRPVVQSTLGGFLHGLELCNFGLHVNFFACKMFSTMSNFNKLEPLQDAANTADNHVLLTKRAGLMG
jgi:hypothetical protein